jgi:hypothetical protein
VCEKVYNILQIHVTLNQTGGTQHLLVPLPIPLLKKPQQQQQQQQQIKKHNIQTNK